MSDKPITRLKKRISQRVDLVSDVGFAKFLNLFHSIAKEGKSIISLGVGEPDFTTPWHICEAALDALKKGYTRYTPTAGFPELRHAVAQNLENRHGIRYDPETEIVITVGSSQAMELAFLTVLDPGDEVIMPDPYYVCYPSCISLAHGVPVPVPTRADNEFKLEADQIEARITPKTKVMLFGYPSNPTGTEMSREDLAEIAELEEKVVVMPGNLFGQQGEGFVRCCYATALADIEEALRRMERFVERYRSR